MTQYEVTADHLNVRRSPCFDKNIVAILDKGDVVAALDGTLILSEVVTPDPSVRTWMKIDRDVWASLANFTPLNDGRYSVSGQNGANLRNEPRLAGETWIGNLPTGDIVPAGEMVAEKVDPAARRWVRLGKAASDGGWASLTYLKATDAPPSRAKREYRVTADLLNVREQPALDAPVVGTVKRDDTFPEDTMTEADGRTWLKIAEPAGYLSMRFMEKVGAAAPSGTPSWYAVARGEIGIKEIPGAGDHPRIVEYHKTTSLPANLQNQDETAWCSSFVNWCVERAGFEGTDSARARSWLNWGARLREPSEGCIVVFSRGSNPASGHVGFYVGDAGSHIRVLGGNQSNAVTISRYRKSRLLGYRTLRN